MSARIDLEAYAGEVKAFSALAEKFVPHSSVPALRRLEQDLRAGISRANSSWTWSTIQEVVFKPSGKYDAPGKNQNQRISLWDLNVSLQGRPELIRRSADLFGKYRTALPM